MSWLYPGYLLLGLLAAGPIWFHLWRQRPRERQPFPAVHLLEDSPPRVNQRGRIEDWLLLLLRVAALCLLAAVFARPFLRSEVLIPLSEPKGRTVLLLVDTSASLQRPAVRDALQDSIRVALAELEPTDQISVVAFAENTREVLPFDGSGPAGDGDSVSRARAAVAELSAGWEPTNLVRAIERGVMSLEQQRIRQSLTAPLELWVASDFANGSELSALRGRSQPDGITLRAVTPDWTRPELVAAHHNAGLSVLRPDGSSAAGDTLRLRVLNDLGQTATFEIVTVDGERSLSQVKVAAGRTQLVTLTTAEIFGAAEATISSPGVALQLRRMGTTADAGQPATSTGPVFDDRVWVLRTDPPPLVVWRSDAAAADDAERAVFFFDQAAALDPQFTIRPFEPGQPAPGALVPDPADEPAATSTASSTSTNTAAVAESDSALAAADATATSSVPARPDLVLLSGPDWAQQVGGESNDPAVSVATLSSWLEKGSTVLVLLNPAADEQTVGGLAPQQQSQSRILTELVARPCRISELAIGKQGQFAEIDGRHPLFTPLVARQFADFTRVRVWKARRLDWDGRRSATADSAATDSSLDETPADDPRVLIRLADGTPALVEFPRGQGRVLVLTTGWQPADSQFALSSKFPPWIASLLAYASPETQEPDQLTIGRDAIPLQPDGDGFGSTQPGVVTLPTSRGPRTFAWNVAPEESRLRPLTAEQLRACGFGAVPDPLVTAETRAAQLQQQKSLDLEREQKLWRLLLFATLVVLAFEPLVAGWTGLRPIRVGSSQ